MKPKNLIWCPDCGKPKQLFETEKKADNFIKYNGGDIDTNGCALRPYYCPACCGWHLSSKEHKASYDSQTDRLIESYNKAHKNHQLVSFDIVNIANKLYETEIPQEIKNFHGKTKRWLTEYFINKGYNKHDEDEIRRLINIKINNGGK